MKRLQAIDIFRALTMFFMIFVNDVAGVKNIPDWIGHTEAREDGMGFADTIFPAFLFIVGLSLPFAIGKRMEKGHSFISIAIHIILRSAALIIMGFYHVNSENYSSAAVLPHSLWLLIVTIAFFLIWLDYPSSFTRIKKNSLIAAGIVLLLWMAFLYKGGDPASPSGMTPQWWGILGIIGWAYLVSALIYLVCRGNLYIMTGVWTLFLAINIMAHTGLLPFEIPVLGDASSATLIVSGVLTGMLYGKWSARNNYKNIGLWFTVIGICMIGLGFAVRPYAGGISKIMATPAWVLICAGISTLVFELVIWLIDKQQKQNWFKFIRPAGTSTLTCYLIPYILYAIYGLAGFRYPSFLSEGVGGIIRSFAIAFIVIGITALLEKIKIRLKI